MNKKTQEKLSYFDGIYETETRTGTETGIINI
jgi:hypothetical protein